MFKYGIHTFNASIKRKITFSYLGLYSVITFLISLILLLGYLLIHIGEDNQEIINRVDGIAINYLREDFAGDELEEAIVSLANEYSVGIEIEVNNHRFISENYKEVFVENRLGRKIHLYGEYKIYSQRKSKYIYDSFDNDHLMAITILRPVEAYMRSIQSFAILLLACFIIGNVSIWFFGYSNNRKILSPIFSMTDTAKTISIQNLDERLDVSQTNYELKDLAMTLNDMLNRLNNDYEKQKRFVSDVSHELRTPISIINGYTNMLKRWGKDDEEILNESIDAIIGEADNMKILVENLLTLVRSDNQTLQFHLERFYIDELVDEIVRETKMINSKHHVIQSKRLDNQLVNMDPQMIKQALRVFVDNAVKYTNDNGNIEVNCIRDLEYIRIQIIDNGIGMTPGNIEQIFNRFYRSDESRTRETGGHGLGLAIAKVIIIGHNGIIRVKSKVGEGSEFNILFPIS